MAKLTGMYDPNAKPESFEVLPAGTYTVKVTAGEMKATKNRDGQYLQIEMTIVDGEYMDRKVFARFNLVNKSKEAVRIANGEFASLREAVGILNPKDTAELMGPRFQVVVKCVRRNDRPDEMTNEIQRYIKRGQAQTTPQQQNGTAPYARSSNAPNPSPTPPPSIFEPPTSNWPPASGGGEDETMSSSGIPF